MLPPLPKISLGCVTFGREIDEAASFAMMDHAYARGVRMFDTAAAYGGGESERIVGRWLASRKPADMLIATKMLPPYDPARIGQSVRESLTRLGVRQIDLFYLHQWHPSAAPRDTLEALDSLYRSGSIRALGASNFTSEQLAEVLRLQNEHHFAPVAALQNNHNFAVRDVTDELRELCATNHIAIITYSPLGAGFLTGKHQHGVQTGSRFDVIPGHQNVYFHEESRRRLAQLEAVAKQTGHSQVQLALSWALHQPGIASVLVGGRRPEHIDQAFDALKLEADFAMGVGGPGDRERQSPPRIH